MRHYLGIRYQGEIHTLSTFTRNLAKLKEQYNGFLPPFFYEYGFDEKELYNPKSKRWSLYKSWPAVNHSDGIALGAFNTEQLLYLAEKVIQENIVQE